MHGLFDWLFIGDGEETFLALLKNGPHLMLELFVNVIEFLVVLLIFRPLAKLWYRRTKKRMHAELDAEFGIEHGTDHDHGVKPLVDIVEGGVVESE